MPSLTISHGGGENLEEEDVSTIQTEQDDRKAKNPGRGDVRPGLLGKRGVKKLVQDLKWSGR